MSEFKVGDLVENIHTGERGKVIYPNLKSNGHPCPVVYVVESRVTPGLEHVNIGLPSKDVRLVSEWEDFKVDDPVMTRNTGNTYWNRGHFAGIRGGHPSTFNYGATSFSVRDSDSDGVRTYWNECRRPTEEELKG